MAYSRKERKNKYTTDVNIKDFYKHYRQTYLNTVSMTIYGKVWNDFIDSVTEKMMTEGYTWKLSSNLGYINVRKYKNKINFTEDGKLNLKFFPVDWKETNKLWEESPELFGKKFIYFLNSHTEGFRYNFRFKPIGKHFLTTGTTSYKLISCRKLSKRLSKHLLEGTIYNNFNLDIYHGK